MLRFVGSGGAEGLAPAAGGAGGRDDTPLPSPALGGGGGIAGLGGGDGGDCRLLMEPLKNIVYALHA